MNTIQPEDRIQKTWIPEGTIEYKTFKHVTQENNFLGVFLKEKFTLLPEDLLLDVGGREGDIAITLQSPEYIHIIDPDPTLHLPFQPGKFLNAKIQDVLPLPEKYKLIICSHVLGYLGNQNVQAIVFKALIEQLEPKGTIVLFYNANKGYMGELLKFSKENLSKGHYDYLDESLLQPLDSQKYEIQYHDVAFKLDYDSYEDLARCCWFLFGAIDQDIDGVAAKFLPKLKEDLVKPTFEIEERVVLIKRKAGKEKITIGQTKYARLLYAALARRGIESITEYPDGHKTIDIAILPARIYIEVDGVQHLNNPDQIITDFKRDYYSEREGFYTLHIHNDDIKNHLNSIADAIAEVVKAKK